MRRIVFVIFATLIMFSVVSCGTQRSAVGHGGQKKGCNCGFWDISTLSGFIYIWWMYHYWMNYIK